MDRVLVLTLADGPPERPCVGRAGAPCLAGRASSAPADRAPRRVPRCCRSRRADRLGVAVELVNAASDVRIDAAVWRPATPRRAADGLWRCRNQPGVRLWWLRRSTVNLRAVVNAAWSAGTPRTP